MIATGGGGLPLHGLQSWASPACRSEIRTDLAVHRLQVVRENTDMPCAIGFGISTPDQAAADGRARGRCHCGLGHCEEDGGPRAGRPADVGAYVKAMKAAVGQGAPQGKA